MKQGVSFFSFAQNVDVKEAAWQPEPIYDGSGSLENQGDRSGPWA